MRSNYKPIGKYVQQVNNRNKDLAVTDLKGININKEFMPSVANTHGTDLSKYKVVNRNQFAFNPMHVGRDEVLPIGMLTTDEPVIVSPAYAVFEVLDEEEVLPEYLMMWCRRFEFDRNAWFTTDNSVRGGFSWNDFCEMTLPVPHIDKQREIVREYNTIVDRIKLNEQLNQKLEETAQALYKQWFVDFEFPISKEYAESIGKPELEGKPYKSSGGEMYVEERTGNEVPLNWDIKEWGEIGTLEYGKGLKSYRNGVGNIPVYGTNGAVGTTENALVDSRGIIIGRKGVYRGVHYSHTPFFVIDTAFYLKPFGAISLFWAYYEIIRFDINGMETGSAIPSTSRDDFYALVSVVPASDIQEEFESLIGLLYRNRLNFLSQNISLEKLSSILLVRVTKRDHLD